MKLCVIITLFALPLVAQTVPVNISVNWPNTDIVRAKYGTLPKSIYPGEVTGCNMGTQTITFSQGTVIQALKTQALEAYSRTDAIAVIQAAQNGAFKSRWLRWSPVVTASLDALNGFIITRVITVGTVAATGIAGATAISKGILPILNGALSQNPALTYEADGMTNLMQLDGGACLVGTVMFATPGGKPAGGTSGQFTVSIPVASK